MFSSSLYRYLLFYFCIITLPFKALAINETYELYSNNGNYYLKAEPTWVPIGSEILTIIPIYNSGDILKLTQVNNTWQIEHITNSEFTNITPLLVTDGGVSYADLNADNIVDITINLGSNASNAQIELITQNASTASFVVREYNVDVPSLPVVAQAPYNPNSSSETGAIQANIDVNNGSASWQTSFDLPKGIAGFTPEVSISYSGNSSNSILGVGWSLNTGSSINRCRQYFEEDDKYQGVNFTSSDELCFNGERLVLNPSSSHFVNGAEYRPKFDPLTKVIYHTTGSNTYFTVHQSNGQTANFGFTSNSRVNDQASGVTYQWLLTNKSDTYGNQIQYTYQGSNSQRKILDNITYAGNEIDFQYVTRTDDSKVYYKGNGIVDDKLLTDVIIKNHSGYAVNSYHFTHTLSQFSARNLLHKIERCNGNSSGVCLQPAEFNYSDDVPSGLQSESDEIIISLADFMTTESNKAYDYCDGNQQFPKTFCNSKSLNFGDTNGDGNVELIVLNGVNQSYEIQNINVTPTDYTLGNISLSGNLTRVGVSQPGHSTYYFYGAGLQTIDSNGDGIDEISINNDFSNYSGPQSPAWADFDGNGIVDSRSSSSSVAENYIRDNMPEGWSGCSGWAYVDFDSSTVNTFDINGDGLVDRMIEVFGTCVDPEDGEDPLGSRYVLVKNTSAGTTYSEEAIDLILPEHYKPTNFADINGDGNLDFLNGCFTGENMSYSCYTENNINTSFSSVINIDSTTDINADGKDDYVYHTTSGKIYADLSEYKPVSQGNNIVQIATTNWPNMSKKTANLNWIDLDGDGIPALVYFDKPNHKIYIRHDANTTNQEPDLLLSVDNGLGLIGEFEYENLLASNNYQKLGSTASLNWGNGSPVFNSNGNFSAVTKYTQTSGIDGNGNTLNAITEFEYKGMRHQAGGRGSLGFSQITEIDVTNKSKTIKEYLQNYPYNGKLKKTTVQALTSYSSYATILTSEVTAWNLHTFFNGELLSLNEKTQINHTYSLSGSNGNVTNTSTLVKTETATQTYSADQSLKISKPVYQSNTTDDGQSNKRITKTTNIYYNHEDAINWRVKRPTKTTTTLSQYNGSTLLDRKNQTQQITYNNLGKVSSQTQGVLPSGNNETQISQYLKKSMVYDLYGNLTSLTQCSSHYAYNCGTRAVPTDLDTNEFKVFNRNILNYDTNGRYLVSKSNALFTEQHLSNYNALGLPQTQTNALGVSQYLSYDEFGRVYFTASDDGSYAQKQLGQCYNNCPINAVTYLSITSPNAPDSITYFDYAGREVATRTKNLTGQWIQSRAEYDARGQKTKIFLPHILNSSTVYQSNFYYDNLGRKWRERAADNTTRTMSWAGLTTTTSVNSYHSSTYSSSSVIQQTSKTNNGFGQLILSQDAHNYNTRYEHDALGALTKATNIDGSITTITYDNYGRKMSMNDPDKGYIQFKYNGIGTVIKRISPNNDQILSFYDAAARLIRKETHSPSGAHTGLFNYSGVFLDSETSNEGIIKQHAYDALGRLTSTSYQIDGNTWNTSNTYDHLGRLFQSFDASGNGRGTQYTYQNGYMNSLREAQNSTQIYYQPTTMDAWGNITQWTLANGATGSASYDNKTGFLKSLFSTNGAVSIQNNVFEYDGVGNLRARVDKNGDNYNSELVEVFNYDLLNRLKTVDFQGVRTLNLTYYTNGGIKSKSDIASNAQYVYGQRASQCSITAGAHALSSIGSKYKYCYDNKGNQISTYENSTKTRGITYTGYDKPSYIESNLSKTWFFYDNQYKRFKRIDNENTGKNKTTYYIGNTEIVNKSDGINEIKRYIGEYVIDTVRSNGTRDTYYLAKDHIGSIVTMMNTTGNFSEKLSYDAFGKRRNGTSWNAIQQPFTDITIANGLTVTEKGFTGHEHVDHANIIHMGGRIYDPSTGRFAQADPIVQAPENGQSLNRYSYVFNNPLSYTDPTGYFAETDCGGAATGGNATCRTTETNDKSETDKTRAKLVADKWKQRQAGNNKNARAISKKIKDYDNKISTGAFSPLITNESGTSGRPVSRTDSDGNVHSWTVNDNIDPSTPEGAWALIQGKQNKGQGYQDWANAGGDRSAWDYPLVAVATWIGGEALAAKLFSTVSMRFASSQKHWGVLADGTNQGQKHFFSYMNKFPDRLPSLERRLGLSTGTFSRTTEGFNAFTQQAQNVVRHGSARFLESGKSIHFMQGAQKARNGTIVIRQNGKLQSMMPGTSSGFKKMN